jgi:hypothetical protein
MVGVGRRDCWRRREGRVREVGQGSQWQLAEIEARRTVFDGVVKMPRRH